MLILLFLLLLLTGLTGAGADPESEIRTLLALKSGLHVGSPALFDTWAPSSSSACNFTFVSCSASGEVSGVDLTGAGVSGEVDFSLLCSLPSLSVIRLGKNALSGAVGAGIRNCSKLLLFDIAFNGFSGELPDLSPLGGLRLLNVSDNNLSGRFPWSSLANMSDLTVLRAGDNGFSLTPEFPAVITKLTKLTDVFLSDANIAGVIPPEIGELTELFNLELADNSLSGNIPPEVAKLTKLTQLELYNNSFVGEIPANFGNLTNLRFFDASMNNLTGDLSKLSSLTNLVSLQLFSNFLSGEVPPEFGEFRSLVNLSLYSNMLTGPLPANLGRWAEFDFIDVSTNFLSGAIPPEMCRRGTMRMLLILENNFTGTIPASYGNCSTLTRFRVSSNQLSGEVPAGIWALPKVNIIDVAGNSFEGAIGAGIGLATELKSLLLSNNRFSGAIPPEIGSATSLVNFAAVGNSFSGELPTSIGELKKLDSLDISGNSLAGAIPASIGLCSTLSRLNLSSNRLSGAIPASLGDLSRLNSIDLSSNELAGAVPASLGGLKLSFLNLSGNRLSGPVPPALAVDAYDHSFLNNPGLCAANSVRFLKQCVVTAEDSGSATLRLLFACILAVIALAVAVVAAVFFFRKRRRSDSTLAKKRSWSIKSFQIVAFDEREIVAGIRNENLIGRGGSGNVYRVKLGDGTAVAVKYIPTAGSDAAADRVTVAMLGARQRSREFEAEVSTLSAIRHINVVKLYCSITSDEGAASLLVYEHLPNGSLWDRLHGANQKKLAGALDWRTRHEIAVGAARGLDYLHRGCHRPVLHRDVKSSNILLDEHFQPRIADFGLAKILHSSGGASSGSVVAGTVGYMAPEYAYTWKATEKSDVYSFGVVLLELVTGRMPIEEGKDVVSWVSARAQSREKVAGVLDPAIGEEWEREEAVRVLRVAVLCTLRLPEMRPSMKAVVQMLEEAADGCRSASTPAAGKYGK